MRTFDFAPLSRSIVGFERLFDLAEAAQHAAEENYLPYNIERLSDDRYVIALALAGYNPDDLVITAEQNVLTIESNKSEKDAEREFLYRGIASRAFKLQFNLADYVQLRGATFENGLLKIELVREMPEAMKPRRISINGVAANDIAKLRKKAAA